MAGDAGAAQRRWELENDAAQPVDAVADSYYQYDLAEQQQLQREKPWSKDPHYFKQVHISALALLKMAMHAKSGGNIEVMGMLQGKVVGQAFIVVDAFALPVEGTETRVNAQTEAYEYMVDFAETTKLSGRLENMVGWYHSHPGYGCWLSGIDCQTQMTQQMFQEPFLAVVIDPHRTIAAGKVDLGAFRTYPENYKPPDEPASEYQTIPLEKIEDFGVHCKSYYALEVDYFKSSLDAVLLDTLWNKYWVNTLAASPLLATRALGTGQLTDIAAKMEASDAQLASTGRAARFAGGLDKKAGAGEAQLAKVCRDASKYAVEQVKGLSCQVVKDLVFNRAVLPCTAAARAPALATAGGPSDAEPMET